MTEIKKIKGRIWALRDTNLKISENIDKSLSHEDEMRRYHMERGFPGEYDATAHIQYRKWARENIAKYEAEIYKLMERLKELEEGDKERDNR